VQPKATSFIKKMQSVKARVSDLIKTPGKVLVFSKTYCPYCTEAKNIFSSVSVAFETYELDNLPDGEDMQNALLEITGQRTVPNIFISGYHVGGCDDLKSKIKSGKVIEILEAAGIPYKATSLIEPEVLSESSRAGDFKRKSVPRLSFIRPNDDKGKFERELHGYLNQRQFKRVIKETESYRFPPIVHI